MKYAIGDRIEIINDNEDEWADRGSVGIITYIKDDRSLAYVHFCSGDYELPGRWYIHLSNVRKLPQIRRTYKLKVMP